MLFEELMSSHHVIGKFQTDTFCFDKCVLFLFLNLRIYFVILVKITSLSNCD